MVGMVTNATQAARAGHEEIGLEPGFLCADLITTFFLNAPKEAHRKIARSREMLTSEGLDALPRTAGSRSGCPTSTKRSRSLAWVREPLAQETFYTGDLFTSG
jgi:hypothetical protein